MFKIPSSFSSHNEPNEEFIFVSEYESVSIEKVVALTMYLNLEDFPFSICKRDSIVLFTEAKSFSELLRNCVTSDSEIG
jgi:hypothetical protein